MMIRIIPPTTRTLCILALILIITYPNAAQTYPQWSVNRDATNCRACHGDFRSNSYVSPSDGELWGNLHNIHRQTMVSGDCPTCHPAGTNFPVELSASEGGDGLSPIGCVGCHGRAEDNVTDNPEVLMGSGSGYGAGLRQHHYNAGVEQCAVCHLDANPIDYTPVGEDVLPVYYANPGNNHPNMPTASCNDDGSENFAGLTVGLDNDGDLVYDESDSDCQVTGVEPTPSSLAILQQNVPNPFNPETVISYRISRPGWVKLSVYDTSGGLVRVLADEFHAQANSYQATWRGQDQEGREVPSGVYYYRLEFEGTFQVGKMALLK